MSLRRSSNDTLFVNGYIFTANQSRHGEASFHETMLVRQGLIEHVGPRQHLVVQQAEQSGIDVHDLQGRTVLPGFYDGHMHLLLLGQSLEKVDLTGSADLEEIRTRLKQFARLNPGVPRILARGWMHIMTGRNVTAAILDDIDDRPIYIDSKDLHSCWCNSAALSELKVEEMSDPAGGKIERDQSGRATGLLSEAAVLTIVWPYLAKTASLEAKITSLRAGIETYSMAGYTGLVDMAMDDNGWEALLELRKRDGNLRMHLAAYWLIIPSHDQAENLAQVQRAIELNRQYNNQTSPDLRLVGIKVICDGVIDACTAALTEPYSSKQQTTEPLWTSAMLDPVVLTADTAGLQCALHAIGDKAIKIAIDAISRTTSKGKRHRIEHLELATAGDTKRLAELEIIASIQPVHFDPAILRAWPKLLGRERLARAFAYKEFLDHGATLAIGSDSPGAHYNPLANMYVATTRRSAKEPGLNESPVNGHFILSLCDAISAATHGSAYSCFAENRTGSLKAGLQADFVVLDMQYDAETLLQASVKQTWHAGQKVFDSDSGMVGSTS